MSMSFRGRLFAAALGAGMLAASAVPAGAETLADAIALAYQNNPTLQAQRANQRVIDETYVQARSGWRPTLGAQVTANWAETQTPIAGRGVDLNGDGVPDSFGAGGVRRSHRGQAGLSFNQPLWTGGRVAAAVNAANADVLAGRENLRRTEAAILAQVIQAYADTRREQETLRIRDENLKVLTRQLQESQARFDVGEVTRTDVAQSQARLAQAQALYQTAVGQLAITRAGYTALVGQNPGELAPEPSLAYMLPTDPDEAFKVAEQFSPQLRAQQYAEQASRARVSGARAERMPSVSGNLTVGHSGLIDPFDPRDNFGRSVSATITASVPIYSGGSVSSRIRQSVERNNSDRITLEGVRRTLLQSVTTFWSQLIVARANITSSEQQVAAARIAAEGTRQEQQVGLRTTIEVLNAEQELRQAELNQVFSRRDEYVAAANVLATMGRLEARNLVPSVAQYDAAKNFRKLRMTWGWVPWEEPVGIVDQNLTVWPSKGPSEKPSEAPISPGLTPAPTVATPAVPK